MYILFLHERHGPGRRTFAAEHNFSAHNTNSDVRHLNRTHSVTSFKVPLNEENNVQGIPGEEDSSLSASSPPRDPITLC
jgi:hypothetical protein